MTSWEIATLRKMDVAALSVINKTGGHKREEATDADVADAKLRVRGAAVKGRRVVRRETNKQPEAP
jgi:hypothetical protein